MTDERRWDRDGGVVLGAVLRDLVSSPDFMGGKSLLYCKLQEMQRKKSKMIELGSGSGLVGIQFAHACPGSQAVLTDLTMATDIMAQNAKRAQWSKHYHIECCGLDWAEDLPKSFSDDRFDLILVSDCTYNTDSIPNLVKTIASLFKHSPRALLVIATKVRHDSEAIFHNYLKKAGIIQKDHQSYPIPDRQRIHFGQELESVDIYVYQDHTCG